jgi:polyhydroxybutyrate depolymerase
MKSTKLLSLFITTLLLLFLIQSNGVAGGKSGSITVDGKVRTFIVYRPAGLSKTTPVPLVLALHGMGMTAADMENATQFDTLADQNGFVVAYLYGQHSQVARDVWDLIQPPQPDIDFINALMDSLKVSQNCNKVYLCGFSAGGYMTNTYVTQNGSSYTSRLNGIGILSSTMTRDMNPNMPISAMIIHGTADHNVSYYGTTTKMGAWDQANHWRAVDICDPADTITNPYPLMTQDLWKSSVTHLKVSLLTIDGMAHVINPDSVKLLWQFWSTP